MGGLFFFGLSQVLLADGAGSARKTEHQTIPIQAAGGVTMTTAGAWQILREPKQGTAGSGKHNSGIQWLLWASCSLTKAVVNEIHSESFPVLESTQLHQCYLPYNSSQEPCWLVFLLYILSTRKAPDPFDPEQSMYHRQWSLSRVI